MTGMNRALSKLPRQAGMNHLLKGLLKVSKFILIFLCEKTCKGLES